MRKKSAKNAKRMTRSLNLMEAPIIERAMTI